MSSVTDDIKARIDLTELIGRSVPLKRSGSSYRGLCPFHQEKTPSFYVFPASHVWVCFGCGKKGSAFDWLMEREHLDFGEALRSLAQLTGVALPERRDPVTDEGTRRLYALLDRAQTYYQGLLWGAAGAAARGYLVEERGLDEPTLRAFGIGFAPPRGGLLPYLKRDGYSDTELVAAGVAGQADDGRLYEFFRERVIFPIRDAQGRTIALGGRALASTGPKYLNSRDTVLFHKQETLFALDLARQSIAQARQAVIVEGYLDAVMAHQHGFANVVATLGTAVTSGHLRQLQRSASEIVLALDADAAGQAATWRTLQLAEATLRSGLRPVVGPTRRQQRYVLDQPVRLRVLALPDAKDPDELIRSDPNQWPALIQAALPVVDFVLERLASRHELATAQGKAAAAAEAVEVLAGIADPIEQAHYVQQLALVLRVDEGAVRQALRGSRRPGRPARELDAERKEAGGASPEGIEGDADEDYVLALVLRLRELDARAEPGELDFAADDSQMLLGAVQAGGPIHPELEPRSARVQQQRRLVEHFSLAQLRRELDRKRLELRRRALQQRQALLHQQMREAAAAERLELAPPLTEVAREISRIDEALQQFDTRGVRDGAASA